MATVISIINGQLLIEILTGLIAAIIKKEAKNPTRQTKLNKIINMLENGILQITSLIIISKSRGLWGVRPLK